MYFFIVLFQFFIYFFSFFVIFFFWLEVICGQRKQKKRCHHVHFTESTGSYHFAHITYIRGCPHITLAAGGGEGVSQMLTIADEWGRGGKPNADDF